MVRKQQETQERRVADSVRHEELEVDDTTRMNRDRESAGYGAPGVNEDPLKRR